MTTSTGPTWFHRDEEDELEQAHWHLQAHREGLVHAHVLDLGVYELGNVMVRALNRDAQQSSAVIEAIPALYRHPLTLPDAAFGIARDIATADSLTFRDAAYSAAREHGCTLVSADRRLVATGHAITQTRSTERLRRRQQG